MDTTVLQLAADRVIFARWVYGPSREVVEEELRRLDLNGVAAAPEIETVPFTASEPTYYLADSAAPGAETADQERIDIIPGDYAVRVVEHTPRKDTKLILYEMRQDPSSAT